MYWKKDKIGLPEWESESVRSGLEPFDPEAGQVPGPEMEAYCRFYGLDLWVEYPDIRYTAGTVGAGGHQVAVHYFRQPPHEDSRGTVFVLHGYFDHVGLYSQLIERCLGAGYDVFTWDQPGHGLSSGTPAAIGSFMEYQAVLSDLLVTARKHTRRPWYAVGQSTGGGILIDYLLSNHHTRETSAFRGVVLLAPLVRPAGWLGAQILHSLMKPFVRGWKRAFSENSANARFLRFLKDHDPLQARAVHVDWVNALRHWVPHIESARPVDFSLTVIQGEKDGTVDWQHNLRIIRNKFSAVKELRLPEGRHHLVNEAQDLQAVVFNGIIDAFERVHQETGVVPQRSMVNKRVQETKP
ncbi:Lysophospholipase, alpha-beta hydrolase superfamily [Marinobacter daqiaonensis]|uniref:Lysophospholipase, alpha-beta hydrolase superfamily n=1 Tax=Marinobacter daqiaonensis TaxID=650891 RepID=A0A1I6HEX0_9GAMM|nr:alpha/beta hydrolase [Marinobacter daqiaonensis]SFR52924.1 Lysophospholipase, alpha-beta hydrolase superfamily [Marinobacter daqiaonensis]